MYDARGDQPGVLGARWSPAPPCWSCRCEIGVRTQRVTIASCCTTCPTHWQSTRRPPWCNSINVIKIDAALRQDWKQIVASLPEGDPGATDANNQAWRTCWTGSDT